jgi:hypothetical protein
VSSSLIEKQIFSFSQLGFLIQGYLSFLGLTQGIKGEFKDAIRQSVEGNPWFTEESIKQSLHSIAHGMLLPSRLKQWVSQYNIPEQKEVKDVGIIMAGNIPLVGFHDLLCVIFSGNRAIIKMSSKDKFLLPMLTNQLINIDHRIADRIKFTPDGELGNVQMVIATGGDNTYRYFESEYGNIPHIFRKNRSSVAVLTGEEPQEELMKLAKDVFSYFGLGCRSVSKIFFPKAYNFSTLLNVFSMYKHLGEQENYCNAYRYAKALLKMSNINFIDGDFFVMYPNQNLHSKVAEIVYEEYENLGQLADYLQMQENDLQCIATNANINNLLQIVPLGETQTPQLQDYADGIDVMEFLLKH